MMTKADCEHIARALRESMPMSATEMRAALESRLVPMAYAAARQWEDDCNAIARALQGRCIGTGRGRLRYSEFLQLCGFLSERIAP